VGFVGKGMLSASVAGDVFASPSAKQVFGGIKAVPSEKGTILIITNCELPISATRAGDKEAYREERRRQEQAGTLVTDADLDNDPRYGR